MQMGTPEKLLSVSKYLFLVNQSVNLFRNFQKNFTTICNLKYHQPLHDELWKLQRFLFTNFHNSLESILFHIGANPKIKNDYFVYFLFYQNSNCFEKYFNFKNQNFINLLNIGVNVVYYLLNTLPSLNIASSN